MGKSKQTRLGVGRCGVVAPALAALTVAVLSACGGGGEGGATPASIPVGSVSIQGTAASGAFMANAQVTVYDADGKTVGTKAADSSGHFEFDITAFRAPFALVATGLSGGETVTYVSVLATKPASGSATVNVTPLTTAIAALLAGGNPLDLISPAGLAGKAQSAQVAQAVALLRAVLANVAADAGLDAATFDPISTPLTVQHQGADSVLDTIQVTLTANGAKLTSNGSVVSDTNGAKVVALTPDLLGKTAEPLPAPTVKTNAATFEAIRANLQACFALAPASRSNGTAALGACAAAFTGDYRNNGFSLFTDLGTLFTAADMNNATFAAPVVLFNGTNALNQATALVRIGYVRSDGSTDHLARLITNTGAGGWLISGNQRNYEAAVTRQIRKITELNAAPAQGIVSRYESSLRLLLNPQLGDGPKVQVVRVTGPGLPAAGAVLARSRACGSSNNLAVQNLTGSLTYSATDPKAPNQTIGTTAQSSNVVVLAATPVNASESVNWANLIGGLYTASNTYPATALSDAEIEAIPTYARYKFEVWNREDNGAYKSSLSPTPDNTFVVTGSGATATPSVLSRQSWNTITSGQDFVTANGTRTAAQTGTTIGWSKNAEVADYLFAFGMQATPAADVVPLRVQIQGAKLARSATTGTVVTAGSGMSALESCTGAAFPAFSAAGDQRMIEVRSTLGDDTQKFSRIVGTVR